VSHLRLAFGQLDSPLSMAAAIEFDGSTVGNTCFAEADLYWAWLVYSLGAGLPMLGGMLLAGSAALLFTPRARRPSWGLAAACAAVGLGAFVVALTAYNRPLLSLELSNVLPGGALCAAAIAKGHTFHCFPSPARRAEHERHLLSSLAALAARLRCLECSRRLRQLRDAASRASRTQEARADESDAGLPSTARSARWGCGLLFSGGALLMTSGMSRLAVYDSCDTPCPSGCPLSADFNAQALLYVMLAVAWLLCDGGMVLLLPVLQLELSRASMRQRVSADDGGRASAFRDQSSLFDTACEIFERADEDRSGEISKEEFRQLLNKVFPKHVDENEQRLEAEFAAADSDGSAGVSFGEFCRYYERLLHLYDSYEDAATPRPLERTRTAV
jgi:hypothetical protein